MVTARVGISGWRYPPWRGAFYPEDLPQRSELAYAAERFATIELNGSFYSLQRPEYYERWRNEVPEDFEFAVKGSRYITHMLRLRDIEVALANFFASGVLALDRNLGPLLWQLPPTMPYERDLLRAFLALLPRDGAAATALARRHDERLAGRAYTYADPRRPLRHALEVRHPSFAAQEVIELLRSEDVALVVADTAGKWPLLEDVTADFVYVRLHGDKELYVSGYAEPALDHWAARVRSWLAGRRPRGARTVAPPAAALPRDVYVYFDNDVKVYAPYDAQRLAAKLRSRRGTRVAVAR